MLIPFPFAFLFGSAVVSLWSTAARRRDWSQTARHMNGLGLGTAVVAAVPGLIDYTFAVPPKSSGRKRATNHMFANVSALALFAAARLGRRRPDAPQRAWALAAELCGAGLLGVGGYLGGTLVYRNQIGVDHRYAGAGKWRVDPRSPDLPPSGEIDAGATDELAVDQMKLIRVGDRRIVVARTERGHVAFDDRCTHKGGPLADGVLACGTVQCPWHGSQFEAATGAVAQGPAREPIAAYDVSERDGRVWIRLQPAGERTEAQQLVEGR